MTQLLVLYASDRGSTRRAAAAVAGGADAQPGCRGRVLDVDAAEPADLERSDALVLGVPVRLGDAHWRMRRFAERVAGPLWSSDRLAGRVGGVFASCGGFGGAGGGAELALLGSLATLAELGLVLTPLQRSAPGFESGGLHWGPVVRTADDQLRPLPLGEASLDVLRRHGAQIARLASALRGPRSAACTDTNSLAPPGATS